VGQSMLTTHTLIKHIMIASSRQTHEGRSTWPIVVAQKTPPRVARAFARRRSCTMALEQLLHIMDGLVWRVETAKVIATANNNSQSRVDYFVLGR